jgi:hypothetical protein
MRIREPVPSSADFYYECFCEISSVGRPITGGLNDAQIGDFNLKTGIYRLRTVCKCEWGGGCRPSQKRVFLLLIMIRERPVCSCVARSAHRKRTLPPVDCLHAASVQHCVYALSKPMQRWELVCQRDCDKRRELGATHFCVCFLLEFFSAAIRPLCGFRPLVV